MYNGYYLTNNVEDGQLVGNVIYNTQQCGDEAVFYCADNSFIGYYSTDSITGSIATGTIINNSL